jgi:glycosyltransferase involved in cell wall biosynthesis
MFVNLISPLNSLGYGNVGYNILKHLYKDGHSVSFFPIGNPEWMGDPDANDIVKNTMKNASLYNPSAPCIRIWHQNDLAMFVGNGKRIGFPIFELDKFNQQEIHHLSSVDELFVCSNWAKGVVEENSINVPTHVVPLGVDSSVFYNDEQAKAGRPWWTKDTTVFINVGKWEVRKGHNELCEAFSKAFTQDDNVELWMLNHNPFIENENELWKRKYIGSPLGSKIKILPRVNTQHELRTIFNQVDYGVFPARAEGWNLEILELMACGVPSIATNYSGHTEYLNEKNSLLLQPTGKEPANDGRWFHGDGQWAHFDLDELVGLLRHAHELKQSGGREKFAPHLIETVNKFGWNNTARSLIKSLATEPVQV